jgi:hypothetical protein
VNAHCPKNRITTEVSEKKETASVSLNFLIFETSTPLSLIALTILLFIPSIGTTASTKRVQEIKLTQSQIAQLKQTSPLVRDLVKESLKSIGIPYKWGGASLEKGIDCSNFTWQLYQKVGLPYDRYLSTQFMSRIHQNGPFQRITFKKARPGDLLVYGYFEEKQWHGHVVILMDKDGKQTGIKGLTLGAHGGDINAVQYITYEGFNLGYFKDPKLKLVNVLRINHP